MTRLLKTIFLLTTILIYSCGEKKSSSDCFGASSPTDLTLLNDCNSNKTVKLFERTGTKDFRLIKTVDIKTDEKTTFCLETEGLENGLYINLKTKTKLIKLKSGEEFKLSLCDTTFEIQNIEILN